MNNAGGNGGSQWESNGSGVLTASSLQIPQSAQTAQTAKQGRNSYTTVHGESGPVVVPVMLTRGFHALVSLEDYARVSALKWRTKYRAADRQFYAVAHLPGSGKRGKNLLMHRFIMNAAPGQRIDHKDGDGLHNWRENLRPATNAQNIRNQRKHLSGKASSQFKGVTRQPDGRFRAQIMCQYKKINLGVFAAERDAAVAYDESARKLHGEFARLNFPDLVVE
jgi:hypothetical protein